MFRHHSSRRAASVLVILASLVVVVSGCRSAVDAQRVSGSLADGPVQQGGNLRVGVFGDLSPKTLLQIGTASVNGHVVANVFDSLISYDNDSLTVHPRLATAWKFGDGGLSLALDLRHDVTYHDGRKFTSKDVEQSLRAYLSGPWTPQFKRTAAAITSYDTADPYRVVLRFAHPLSNIFDLLDSAPIIDGSTLDKLTAGTEFNGTGPFRFDSWTPRTSVRLVRNSAYWGKTPALDSVTLVEARDSQSLYSRLRAGQLDVVTELADHDAEVATSRYGYRGVPLTGSAAQTYLGINVANPALADVRLRRAIAYAIDRDRIAKDVYRGTAVAANLPWPKSSPAYDAAANRTYVRNVAKARALVNEIGNVPTIQLDYPVGGNERIVAEIVQSNLKDVGITVNLLPNDATVQAKKLIGAEFPGLWLMQHGFAQFTPSTLAVSAYPFNAAKNSSNYQDAAYSAAATESWTLPDGTSPQALAAYRKLNAALLKDLFIVEIAVVVPEAVTAPSVQGISWDRRSSLRFDSAGLAAEGRS